VPSTRTVSCYIGLTVFQTLGIIRTEGFVCKCRDQLQWRYSESHSRSRLGVCLVRLIGHPPDSSEWFRKIESDHQLASLMPVSEFSYFFGSTVQRLAVNSLEHFSDLVEAAACGRVVVCVIVCNCFRTLCCVMGLVRVRSPSPSESGTIPFDFRPSPSQRHHVGM
jgi:hypothetical protein